MGQEIDMDHLGNSPIYKKEFFDSPDIKRLETNFARNEELVKTLHHFYIERNAEDRTPNAVASAINMEAGHEITYPAKILKHCKLLKGLKIMEYDGNLPGSINSRFRFTELGMKYKTRFYAEFKTM